MQSPAMTEAPAAPRSIFSHAGSYEPSSGSGESYATGGGHSHQYSNGTMDSSDDMHSPQAAAGQSLPHPKLESVPKDNMSTYAPTPVVPHSIAAPIIMSGPPEGFPSPTLTEQPEASTSPRRVYIPPPSAGASSQYFGSPLYVHHGHPQSSGMTTAQSSSSTSAAFSTHDPPTPGPESAPAHMTGFRVFSPLEQSNIAYAQAHGHTYIPGAHPFVRRASADDGHHFPQTPLSAYGHGHPSMLAYHQAYSHYPYGSAAAKAAFAPTSLQADERDFSLPPPSATSSVYSSSFPASPYDIRGSGMPGPASHVHWLHSAQGIGIGHPAPLPPIRTKPSRTFSSAKTEKDDEEVSPKLSAAASARLLEPIAMSENVNLEEECKTIEAASGATAFVSKLWFLLSQPQEFGEYIRWTCKGTGFILSHNSPTFGEAILSRFFRHSNIASFVRQLNLYKMVRMSQLALLEDLNDSGGRVDGELTHTGFSHPCLQRGHPELLHKIKPQSGRKKSKSMAKSEAEAAERSPTLASTSPGKKTRTFAHPMPLSAGL